MLASGVDAITLGNHVWRRGEIVPYLEESERVVRPANLSRRAPGRGLAFVTAADGTEVAVANLLGALFIGPPVGPFEVVDEGTGETHRWTVLGATEADPAAGRLSAESPVAKALLGARPGEVVEVQTPRGARRLRVQRLL